MKQFKRTPRDRPLRNSSASRRNDGDRSIQEAQLKIAEHFSNDTPHVGKPSAARRFSEPYDNRIEEWWDDCPCGSWMLWVAGNRSVEPTTLVAIACECARQSLVYLPPDESRPESVLLVAEGWVRSERTKDECRAAGDRIAAIQQEIGARLQDDSLPPIEGVHAGAAMMAAASVEMPAMAAAWSHDPSWCANFACQAATRSAAAARLAVGDDAWWEMQNQCAQIVRKSPDCRPDPT